MGGGVVGWVAVIFWADVSDMGFVAVRFCDVSRVAVM